jgi:hypothetical protein
MDGWLDGRDWDIMYDLLICNFVFSGVNGLYITGCKTHGVGGTIRTVLPTRSLSNFL